MTERAVIRSRENSALKRVGALRAGKLPELLLLEGDRLVDEARVVGLEFESVLVSEERAARAAELEAAGLPVRRVEARLLARVSDLVTSPGVLAVCAAARAPAPGELDLAPDALGLVVAGLSDPGNLGALARSAEAAGCTFLALIAGGVGATHPRALRGSMGSLLRLPVLAFDDPGAALAALDDLAFRHVCAATREGLAPARADWSGRVAVWIGGETASLPPAVLERATALSVPMAGGVESLNVTVAASLLLFAAERAG